LLAHGWRFYPDTTASSTTKTGRHEIAEILLKVALNTINKNKNQWSLHRSYFLFKFYIQYNLSRFSQLKYDKNVQKINKIVKT
jgi:hypothetical protein